MSSGLLTILSVGGTGPSYSLTVDSSSGVSTGDHIVAALESDPSHGGIYRVTDVPDGSTIDIEDDLKFGGGTYGDPDAGEAAYWTPTLTLGISTDKELNTPYWGDILERDFLIIENSAYAGGMTAETLTYMDTTNKVIGPLAEEPTEITSLNINVINGIPQEYTKDYTVREVVGGSSPGFYVCVSPTSSAPGGGAFNGGTNPGTGIAAVLVSGDKVRATYPYRS